MSTAKKAPAKKAAAKSATKAAAKTPAKKVAAKTAAPKKPRTASAGGGKTPSTALAAVIGAEAVLRTEAVKKIWDYIKANNLQDAKDKRSINADTKLKEVFGKDQVTMFELAGILGKHLA